MVPCKTLRYYDREQDGAPATDIKATMFIPASTHIVHDSFQLYMYMYC